MDVRLPADSELPPEVVERLQSLPPINIYRMLANVPQSLIPWADLVGALYQCELDDRLREIAICRQARAARASYELHQHRLIARNNGVSDTELESVLGDPVVTSLDDHANLVCQVADEIESAATLSDGTQAAVYATLGDRQATELILVLSFYCAVARFTNATRTRVEQGDPLANVSDPTSR